MSNKITTLGYFRKRLRDCGYSCIEVFKNYNRSDPRVWTAIIDPGGSSIFCTCYLNYPELGDNYLELYDGGQRIPSRIKLQTSSFEILIEYLNKLDVLHVSNIDK